MSQLLAPASPDSHGQEVTATGVLKHLCPFVDEEDHGTITVTWKVGVDTIELHALAAYLSRFEQVRISHEDLTARIASELDATGVEIVDIKTSWSTAGFAVTVEG